MDINGHTPLCEDYISFETAKLLKEKGFDYQGFDYIDFEGEVIRQDRPTLQMAMKWLREVHNIFIEISVDEMLKDEGYQWALYNNSTKEIRPYSGWEHSYEQACEAAIKYCLTDLIK